jgi:basic membrane protein A and related proteins
MVTSMGPRSARRLGTWLAAWLLAVLMAACGSDGADETTAADPTTDDAAEAGETEADGTGETTGAAAESDLPPFAMILSGPISDADYNALGHEALTTIGERFGVETTFSEGVPVGDAARIAQEYIVDGSGIISMHSGIYLPIAQELAANNSDTIFITQGSAELEAPPDNIWHIGRKFAYNSAFFLQGYLAGSMTETGTVAFIGAVDFPDAIGGANSFFLGAREANPDVELLHTFTGDFVDPVTARRAAEALIAEGADVLSVFLNEAVSGVAQAAEQAPHQVYFTALYTEKSSLSPDHYLVSANFDFISIFTQIFEAIEGGERSGFIEMSPVTGGVTLGEMHNVPPELEEEVRALYDELASGERELPDPSVEEIQEPA